MGKMARDRGLISGVNNRRNLDTVDPYWPVETESSDCRLPGDLGS
jgi:hypothetical protein